MRKRKERVKRSHKEMAAIRRKLDDASAFAETAELIRLTGYQSRLKLLYLLDTRKEVCVSDLSEILELTVSAVSQHLAKLKMHGLVAARRHAQTVGYSLTDHPFIAKLQDNFLRQFQVAGGAPPRRGQIA
jgi:DNA-binding transcriptional ArsR family regulator